MAYEKGQSLVSRALVFKSRGELLLLYNLGVPLLYGAQNSGALVNYWWTV